MVVLLLILFIGTSSLIINNKHSIAVTKTITFSRQKKIALQEKQPIPEKQSIPEKQPIPNKQPIPEKSKILDVPLINQMAPPQLYNGCEVTSLAMLLNYFGYKVTKNELALKIKTVPFRYKDGKRGNPNIGFVGDMFDGPGLGVYNGPIYELAKRYAGDKVVNLTKSPFTDLLKKIDQGMPVWIITTSKFAPVSVFQNWNTPEGKIQITFSEHSVIITGYDEHFIYINNPYGIKNEKLNRETFQKAWEQMGSQAITINK